MTAAGIGEPQRLQQLALDDLSAQRTQIQQDLARQIAQLDQQMQWREGEVGRETARLAAESPEMQGRLGSSFAARGSYSSGARQEAEQELADQYVRQIEGMRTELEQQKTKAAWEKEQLNLAAQRGMDELKRREEAQQLQWSLARKQASASGRGGGFGAGSIDSDEDRSTINGFINNMTKIYQSRGFGIADARARAIVEAKQRYPGRNEAWYLGEGLPNYGTYAISAVRGQALSQAKRAQLVGTAAYREALADAQAFYRSGATSFKAWFEKTYKSDPASISFMQSHPQLFSVALMNASNG